MPFYRVPVSDTLLEPYLDLRFPEIFFFVSKFLVSKSSLIDRTNTSSCHGTSPASWSGSHGFPAAGAVTTEREKPRAWELEDQEERDRYGDAPRPKRTGHTLARTRGSPPGPQAGQCDGRRLLRKMVRLMFARKSRSCAHALSVPAEIGGGCVARLMRAFTLTGRVSWEGRRAGGAASMGKMKRYWSWPRGALRVCNDAGNAVVARASFPELATRQTLARRALSARGA